MYNIRRSSASGVFYGERVCTGTLNECFAWIREVLKRRVNSGWEYSMCRNISNERVIELTHDDRADVHWFTLSVGEF
jgi:hypothetical protein